jgi:hypothetical protein
MTEIVVMGNNNASRSGEQLTALQEFIRTTSWAEARDTRLADGGRSERAQFISANILSCADLFADKIFADLSSLKFPLISNYDAIIFEVVGWVHFNVHALRQLATSAERSKLKSQKKPFADAVEAFAHSAWAHSTVALQQRAKSTTPDLQKLFITRMELYRSVRGPASETLAAFENRILLAVSDPTGIESIGKAKLDLDPKSPVSLVIRVAVTTFTTEIVVGLLRLIEDKSGAHQDQGP